MAKAGRTIPTTYVAFLRGINVGGKRRITMGELRACFSSLRLVNVRTVLASGNVIEQVCASPTK
jgi:uncharacterized protein (DUF1697 family)